MTVWGIADLHLWHDRPPDFARLARNWQDHSETIERHWRDVVRPGDVVLLPGDVSMARSHRAIQPDLAWLDRLPGTKVLSAGNHDRWFNRVEVVRPLLRRSVRAVGGDAIEVQGVIVCGTRGTAPPEDEFPVAAGADVARELGALDQALAHAAQLRTAGQPLFVLWHYPPFDAFRRPGPCVERFLRHQVTACLYGHVHARSQWPLAVQGEVDGVRYHCVAADAIGFRPLRIAVWDGSN